MLGMFFANGAFRVCCVLATLDCAAAHTALAGICFFSADRAIGISTVTAFDDAVTFGFFDTSQTSSYFCITGIGISGSIKINRRVICTVITPAGRYFQSCLGSFLSYTYFIYREINRWAGISFQLNSFKHIIIIQSQHGMAMGGVAAGGQGNGIIAVTQCVNTVFANGHDVTHAHFCHAVTGQSSHFGRHTVIGGGNGLHATGLADSKPGPAGAGQQDHAHYDTEQRCIQRPQKGGSGIRFLCKYRFHYGKPPLSGVDTKIRSRVIKRHKRIG